MITNKVTVQRRLRLGALVLSFAASFTAAGLRAQTASSPSTSEPSIDDDTVVLSPFIVTAEEDSSGYTAQNTLAGTRVRTDLRDVGSAISIVTQQFLRDTGSTNAEQVLVLTTNTEVAGQGGNFIGAGDGARAWGPERAASLSTTRVRGLDSADNTRDFFLSVIPWDTYNTGGLDIQRGPNSVLFGIGSPAGIINARINQASFKTSRTVEARFDNFGTARFSGDFNQVVIPKQLAIRVALLDDNTKYRQEPSFRRDKRIYGAVRWAPQLFTKNGHNTDVRINAEKGDIDRVDPLLTPPVDMITPWFGRMNKKTFASADSSSLITSNAANFDPSVSRAPYGFSGNGLWAVFANPNATTQSGLFASNGAGVNLVGIAPFAIYAGSANIAGNQVGSALYKDKSLTDASIFDFYNNNLYGENIRASQNFNTFNAALSQTFFSDRFGIELAFDKQNSIFRNRHIAGGAGYGISVDVMREYADGTPNPNVGRPMALAGQYSNSNRNADDRETLRATAFADVKAEDFVTRDSLAARIIGRHVFTGSLSRFDRDITNANWNNVYTSTTDPRYPTSNVDSDSHRVSQMTYLGGQLLGASTPSGLNLPRIGAIQVPQSGTVRHYSTTPAPGGWTSVDVPVTNTENFTDDTRPYQGGRKLRDRVDSQVLVWQGFFLDRTIIPMFGWRRDRATTQDAGTPTRALGIAKLTDPNWRLPNDSSEHGGAFARTYAREEGDTKTFSIVGKLPESWMRKMPGHLDFSVFFNRSENFRPLPGRRTYVGDDVSSPNGQTKEYGVMVSALDGKVNLKINRYHTKAQRVSLDGSVLPGWMLGYEAVFREAALQYKHGLSWRADTVANSWIPVYGQTSAASPYGSGKKVIWEPDPSKKMADGTYAAADLDAMYDLMIKSADAMLANPIPLKMQQAWGMSTYENGSGANREVNYTGYGVALVGNTESKGTEFELTANPVPGLDIAFNASRTDARRVDVGQDLSAFILGRYELFKNTPAGRLRIWGGGAWSDAPGGSDTPLTGYSNFMIPGYQLAVALNGTTVPELRPWRFNTVVNYKFQNNLLKGFNVGSGYRWQDREVVGFAFNASRTGYDINKRMFGPREDSLDLWIGYERKITRSILWRAQLNIRDLFANDKLIPVSRQPDGSAAAYRLPEPRMISLTNTFSF